MKNPLLLLTIAAYLYLGFVNLVVIIAFVFFVILITCLNLTLPSETRSKKTK